MSTNSCRLLSDCFCSVSIVKLFFQKTNYTQQSKIKSSSLCDFDVWIYKNVFISFGPFPVAFYPAGCKRQQQKIEEEEEEETLIDTQSSRRTVLTGLISYCFSSDFISTSEISVVPLSRTTRKKDLVVWVLGRVSSILRITQDSLSL